MRKLIGLTGRIGSGKSTVAAMLVERGFKELSFKSELVQAIRRVFRSAPNEVFFNRELKEQPCRQLYGRTPREIMQSFGTDWARKQVHPDIWLQRVMDIVNGFSHRDTVISDVRFDNEAQAILDAGGVIWEVIRPGNPFAQSDHVSELGLSGDIDTSLITNRFDFTALQQEITTQLRIEKWPTL